MKFVTDLLTRWALATGKADGTELRGATQLNLPASLQPVAIPRFPTRIVVAQSSGTQSDSFLCAQQIAQPASSGGAVLTIVTLAKGAWELLMSHEFTSDYTLPALAANANQMVFGGQSITNIIPLTAQRIYTLFPFTVTLDTQASVQYIYQATGAGQNAVHSIVVFANRLS